MFASGASSRVLDKATGVEYTNRYDTIITCVTQQWETETHVLAYKRYIVQSTAVDAYYYHA